MKYTFVTILLLFQILIVVACNHATPIHSRNAEDKLNENDKLMKDSVKITVGGKIFTATLFDNASANAFREMLPLTMNMTELNGNEKYFRLTKNLPANASNPGTINSGDLMLWGAETFVLFYQTFPTSYSYTKLGKISNAIGLEKALGAGDVTVTFELQKKG
jgi:hypothetical protein